MQYVVCKLMHLVHFFNLLSFKYNFSHLRKLLHYIYLFSWEQITIEFLIKLNF